MREAVIVSAVRTAVGKAPKGTLRATRPDDLCAAAIQGALDRVPNLDRKEVEDVIIGCAMPEGRRRRDRRGWRRIDVDDPDGRQQDLDQPVAGRELPGLVPLDGPHGRARG